MSNLFSSALIFFAGVIAGFYLNLKVDSFFWESKKLSLSSEYHTYDRALQIVKMIENDFLQLSKLGKLPPEWSQISKVDFRSISIMADMLMGERRPYFNINKSGSKYLEIDFIDLNDSQNPGLILQASVFELDSKNKIFEIGRTYSVSQYLDKSENGGVGCGASKTKVVR